MSAASKTMEESQDSPDHGIFGLNRKTMEQERLARVAARKRERPISPPPRKRPKIEGSEAPNTSPDGTDASASTRPNITKPKLSSPELRFPYGVIRKTWAAYHPPDERTIRIEDIIDKENVRTAVLSTFIMNPDWILPGKFDLKRTKFYMILHAQNDKDRLMLKEDFHGVSQARLCMPKLKGAFSCQHSKLMLLFFPEHVRIVVPSANLVDFDWGESGVMENSVFIVDLPRHAESKQRTVDDLPDFGQSLSTFLENQGVAADVREGLLNFDFAATKRLAFIHTSEGSHLNAEASDTGLPSLAAAVRRLGLDTSDDVQIDFAASSIGSLSDEFLNTIYEAAQGKDITMAATRERRKKQNPKVMENFRIYFPTINTVEASIGGTDNAGTICLSADYWKKDGFPQSVFRDYVSKRQGLLSHNKLLFVRGKKNGKSIAWVYAGSANCSGAAWGTLVTKGVKLNCNNWEAGVLVPVDEPPDDLSDLGKVFEGVIDVPFEFGDEKDLKYKGRKPWFYKRDDR